MLDNMFITICTHGEALKLKKSSFQVKIMHGNRVVVRGVYTGKMIRDEVSDVLCVRVGDLYNYEFEP